MRSLAHHLVRLAVRLPRGGYWLVQNLAKHSDELQAYPIGLRLLPGITVRADLRESVWFPLLKYGWHPDQVAEDRLALSLLREGECVWDIGANIGYTGLIFARGVGPTGSVIAVEPSRRTFPMLCRTTEQASTIRPIHAAVSSRSGTVSFSDASMLNLSAIATDAANAYQVRCLTLDELATLEGIRPPDFLKVDVEGHELEVFEGGRQLFARHRPLIEFEALTADACVRVGACLAELSGADYEILRIRSDGKLVPPDDTVSLGLTSNYLAFTESQRVRVESRIEATER